MAITSSEESVVVDSSLKKLLIANAIKLRGKKIQFSEKLIFISRRRSFGVAVAPQIDFGFFGEIN